MIPFSAPVPDIVFSLRNVARCDEIEGWDDELSLSVLEHFAAFAEGVIAPLNATGDAEGARLEEGRVHMPAGFGDAFSQLAEGGWQGLSAPEAYGGMAASPMLSAGVSEMFSGANHAMQMVCNLVPGAISTLMKFGTQAQQAHWVPQLVNGDALSTMCLTEPAAGSDLSAIRTRATRTDDGWQINGEKIFISGGDQDMSSEILHVVLARSGEVTDGIRGLSLFICGKQPGVRITRIEEKLGLHASPTCQMVFDNAQAELIGAEGEGLAAMFTLMNHARLDVALQGVAHAARAHQIAEAYASERKQGRKADGAPAMLTDHADVQRMLDEQHVLAIGARAMCHISLLAMERGAEGPLCEFLTSLCKVYGSEAGPKSADLGMQILGGYGYLQEYGMEQIWRDARICAIYEGANGIHTRALATRGLREGGGADAFEAFVMQLSEGAIAPGLLAAWQAMKAELRAMADPSPMAHAFYLQTAALFEHAVWLRIRAVAGEHHQPERITRLADTVLSPNRYAGGRAA